MLPLRDWIARNIAATMFIVFYSVTIVTANLIFATPFGAEFLGITGFPTKSLTFGTSFTLGFWMLLLIPLVAVPVLVPILRRLFVPIVSRITRIVPDFTGTEHATISAVFYAIAAWSFWRSGAIDLAASAHDAIASVEARFLLQERMHFSEKIVIHAILPFLAYYAVVAAFRVGGRFWIAMSAVQIIAVTFLLIGVNMKWPALLFMIALVAATFIFSSKYPYIKAAIGGVFLVCFYLTLSTYVFRLVVPEPVPAVAAEPSQPADQPAVPSAIPSAEQPLEYAIDLVRSSLHLAPELLAHAVNRMAIAYPYYYNVFTTEGQVCGGLWEQAHTSENVRCRPSWLIYTRIFGEDQFEGRGTAPAAPHITAYALGGWPLAILGVLGICVVLAAFSAIPINAGLMSSAFIVVGATAGYHLSQIPGEGVVFYDHGFFWPMTLVFLFSCYRHTIGLLGKNGGRQREKP